MDITFTRIPDVVAALVELGSDVLNPDPEAPEEDPPFAVTVLDGPTTGQDTPDDVLMIGVGNEEDADPYRTSRDNWDNGGRSRESGVIRCQAATWSGDTDLAVLRAKLIAWLEALEGAFRDDQQLAGTCDLVRMGSARWYHLQRPGGAGVGVHFDVTYEAWL